MRECGNCTMCCKLLAVEALEKPAGVMCKHACGKCAIYEERPTGCRTYSCLWLTDERVPEDFKPSKVKAVLNAKDGAIQVFTDRAYGVTPASIGCSKFGDWLKRQPHQVTFVKT
jgi:hypothetical protein